MQRRRACRALGAGGREIVQQCEDLLAATLREELTPPERSGPLPGLLAGIVVAGKRAILEEVRRRVLAGSGAEDMAAAVRSAVEEGFGYLEHGLGRVGGRPPPANRRAQAPARTQPIARP